LAKRPEVPLAISRQFLSAGTSVGANLAEAKGGQTRRDATAKFSIALKEAREAEYWLRLPLATHLGDPAELAPLLKESGELVAILTTARRRLNQGS
jgi:four helix bundle protein